MGKLRVGGKVRGWVDRASEVEGQGRQAPGSESRVGNKPGRDEGQMQTLLAFLSPCVMQGPMCGSPVSLPLQHH